MKVTARYSLQSASPRPGLASWPALPLPWLLWRRRMQVLARWRRVLRSCQGFSRIAMAQGSGVLRWWPNAGIFRSAEYSER
jgi:hypothetical protein